MFQISQSNVNAFSKLFETHHVQISACDVYFQNIRMLSLRKSTLTRDDFCQYYKNFTNDIELVTSPIDAFIPSDADPDDPNYSMFITNQTVPEYQRIKNRITWDELHQTLPATHPVIIALDEHKITMDNVIDDIFTYYNMYKYIDQLSRIRLSIFSNMTPVIEYIVENITIDDIKRYMVSNKINPEKIAKHRDLLFFAPDYKMICDFYMEPKTDDIPKFDLNTLINRLMSNICLKSDIYIILGMYLTASFAVADFNSHAESPCADYVKNVLANL